MPGIRLIAPFSMETCRLCVPGCLGNTTHRTFLPISMPVVTLSISSFHKRHRTPRVLAMRLGGGGAVIFPQARPLRTDVENAIMARNDNDRAGWTSALESAAYNTCNDYPSWQNSLAAGTANVLPIRESVYPDIHLAINSFNRKQMFGGG
jgi:hypothetical protein